MTIVTDHALVVSGLPPIVLLRPTITAAAGTDPSSGAPQITLTVTSSTVIPSYDSVTATILRSDGGYVLGASPLFPLTITGGTASVVDRTAPYGVTSTYVASLTLSSSIDPPAYSPPSVPSAPVVMGQAPDTLALYDRMGWAQDEDVSGVLLQWLSGTAEMAQSLDSLTTDGYDRDGNPSTGWSQVLDIDRCPTSWLPWLAQFVGVILDPTQRDDQMRYAIENPQGWSRGTPAAILATINQYLAPGYTAVLFERDSSPYHLTIEIPTGGYVGSTTCLQLSHEYPTCADLILEFATCLLVWKSIPSGATSGATTCGSLIALYATCAVLATDVTTCLDLWSADFFISTALDAVVPAGIVVELVYL